MVLEGFFRYWVGFIVLITLMTEFSFLEALDVDEMTIEEKVGQLFIAPLLLGEGREEHFASVKKLIEEKKVGSLIVKTMDHSLDLQLWQELWQELREEIKALTRSCKSMPGKGIPVLFAVDAEPGLAPTTLFGVSLPYAMTLGATSDPKLLFEAGYEIGKRCKELGFHLNFAPVVDVNTNPKNPIIHMRSLAENPFQVVSRAQPLIQGMHAAGVFSTLKHFPGHGDTEIDSHSGLASLFHDLDRLRKVELFPFRALAEQVPCIMTGHICLPSLACFETAQSAMLPATFSPYILQELLRKECGFTGCIISDALNMGAISYYFSPEEGAFKAFEAGCDLLLYSDHIAQNVDQIIEEIIPRMHEKLVQALQRKEISEEMLNEKVKRILLLKERAELFQEEGDVPNQTMDQKAYQTQILNEKIFKSALQIIQRHKPPLQDATSMQEQQLLQPLPPPLFLWKLGSGDILEAKLKESLTCPFFSSEDPDFLLSKIPSHFSSICLLAIEATPIRGYGPKRSADAVLHFLKQALKKPCQVILVLFGTPYFLTDLSLADVSFENLSIMVAYQHTDVSEQVAADQLLHMFPHLMIEPKSL